MTEMKVSFLTTNTIYHDDPLKHMASVEWSPTRRIVVVKRADYSTPPLWEGCIIDVGAVGRLTMKQATAFNVAFQNALELAAGYDELYPAGSLVIEQGPTQ